MIEKIQSKLATHWGAYYDKEKAVDVWPEYAVRKAVRETMIVAFIGINLATYFAGMGEGLNTGVLPTGLSTSRAIIMMVIFLKMYYTTANLLGRAMEKIPVIEYREDLTEPENADENTVIKYVEKKYEDEN